MAVAIVLGVLAGLVVLCTISICVVRHCQDGPGSAKDGGGGGVSSATGKQDTLLNKNNGDDVVAATGPNGGGGGVSSATGRQDALLNKNKGKDDVVVAAPHQPGGFGGQRGPEQPSDGDVDLCAICKARLADASWGRCRRLRPCGHVYHADCIGLWLQRKSICPVCRSAVAMSRTEILDAIV